MQTPDPDAWVQAIENQASWPREVKPDWERHCQWWKDFWARGWIIASDRTVPAGQREKLNSEADAKGLRTAVEAAAKDLAMQVAATLPAAVGREEISPELIAKEKAIYEAAAKESGKPDKIIEKMVVGRLEKFYKEVCLVEQPFVKDSNLTVTQFLKQVGASLGGKDLKVKRFTRFQVGA